MPTQRYSVMVLPRHAVSILLQSFTDGTRGPAWDGFGTFRSSAKNPESIARRVIHETFGTENVEKLTRAAELHHEIHKPHENVQLTVNVFLAEMAAFPTIACTQAWFMYGNMHPATAKWLPLILQKEGHLTASMFVEQPGSHISGKVIDFTDKV